ncbi:MAG: hypothetical protein IPN90_12725 [Elusimicrobia bacterium]|nr:hypothetical protein [Elusimicrobiota bacterium]
MNKKLLAVAITGLGLLGLGTSASALNFANANLKVTVNGDLSMTIVGSPDTTLPAVLVGGSSISGSAIVVKNDSLGMIETFTLKSFDSGTWLLKDVAGPNEMAIQALFNSAMPGAGDFVVPADSLTLVDKAAAPGIFEGDQSGAGVNPNGERSIWFKFDAPTATNSTGSRDLTVSIVAGL